MYLESSTNGSGKMSMQKFKGHAFQWLWFQFACSLWNRGIGGSFALGQMLVFTVIVFTKGHLSCGRHCGAYARAAL